MGDTIKNYDITLELPNGDWTWRRVVGTFHYAAECGLSYAKERNGKLIRIQQI